MQTTAGCYVFKTLLKVSILESLNTYAASPLFPRVLHWRMEKYFIFTSVLKEYRLFRLSPFPGQCTQKPSAWLLHGVRCEEQPGNGLTAGNRRCICFMEIIHHLKEGIGASVDLGISGVRGS